MFHDNGRFILKITFDAFLSEVSADTWIFVATKRQTWLEHIPTVDINCSCFQFLLSMQDFWNIIANDSSSKPIITFISPFNDLIKVVIFKNRHYWTEDLLLRYSHTVSHAGKNSRLNKKSFSSMSLTSCKQFCAICLSMLYIGQYSIHLFFANQGSLVSILVKWIS